MNIPSKGSSFYSKVVITGEIPGFVGDIYNSLLARPLPLDINQWWRSISFEKNHIHGGKQWILLNF
jgi:hypothetical protein